MRVWTTLALSGLLCCVAGCGNSPEPLGGSSLSGVTSPKVQADFHTRNTLALAAGEFELLTLSTLPEAVTGNDVLIAVRGLPAADALRLTVNGAVFNGAVTQLEDGERRALVTGLRVGANELVATAAGTAGARLASLVVRNHPITGPVLSGPHQTPFICRTEEAGLGAPTDANCSAPTRYEWFYRSLDQGFKALADPYAAYPSDVLTTHLRDGRAVPYVVRVETATINRSIARMAVLDDPFARGAAAPFAATEWNGRIYQIFGESCGTGYEQGSSTPTFVMGGLPDLANVSASNLLINLVGIDQRLGVGDITVHSTLAAFGNHCNPLISMETTMMLKEHINEQYGLVREVVGTNGSGAALQQYNAINNAPGLLSAAMPTATFADIVTTAMTVTDCGLLQHYYANSALDWSVGKQAAVNGHSLLTGNQLNAICQSWTDAFLPVLDPLRGCSGAVPEAMRYHPVTNPKGTRCTIQDANVNIFGRDPATGFARRPLDNGGVQYGLAAYNAGTISAAEFIDLNRQIGGYDIDGQPQAARHVMDPEVERISYLIGGVIGRGALAETPVMDIAPYLDLIPTANIHEAVRPFVVRARLREHSGQDATQSIWRGVLTQPDAFATMDAWLDNLQRPAFGGDHVAAVTAAKPTGASDRCSFGTIGGRLDLPAGIYGPLGIQLPLLPGVGVPGVVIPLRVDVPEDFDSGIGPCSLLLAVTRTPRMAAGMPLSDDIIKCQLKPVTASDYTPALTEPQLGELREIFPTGVCDFTKPAAGDVQKSILWPSVGGTTRVEPFGLLYTVGRSRPL
ncbi:MAG: DUF6351 family protein [Stagnimonas sp.]|nr:DUF6351 family protein [Stagnimonas sp.]